MSFDLQMGKGDRENGRARISGVGNCNLPVAVQGTLDLGHF